MHHLFRITPDSSRCYVRHMSKCFSCSKIHLSGRLSLSSSANLPACMDQYSKGATHGSSHTGGATQISVLIWMGKGLRVQLQVTLRVAQKGGGDGVNLLKVTTPSAWQWWRRLWDVLLGQRGKNKKGMETKSLPGTFFKWTQGRMLDVRLSHSTLRKRKKKACSSTCSLCGSRGWWNVLRAVAITLIMNLLSTTGKRLQRIRCSWSCRTTSHSSPQGQKKTKRGPNLSTNYQLSEGGGHNSHTHTGSFRDRKDNWAMKNPNVWELKWNFWSVMDINQINIGKLGVILKLRGKWYATKNK